MNDEQFDDLKQFIANTVGQSEARLREDLASKEDLKRLEQKVDDGFRGIGEAIDALGEDIDKRFNEQDVRLDDHGRRISRLEKRIA